jgi:membrane protein implicated in regulation of membrane protease activity
MEWLLQHPVALWLSAAAALLALEVGTGSGWLLWPAGAAAIIALAVPPFVPDLQWQLAIFAVLTIALTLAGRHFFPRVSLTGSGDINDAGARLAGSTGVVAQAFLAGQGRVFVDGQEWTAVLEGGDALALGARVQVVAVDSARLTVRPL